MRVPKLKAHAPTASVSEDGHAPSMRSAPRPVTAVMPGPVNPPAKATVFRLRVPSDGPESAMPRCRVRVPANMAEPAVMPSVTPAPASATSMSWPTQRPLPAAISASASEGAVPLSPISTALVGSVYPSEPPVPA
ncbi:MAG: hypothetical protein BWX70_02387 [Verrucomicrobia bacterium ADurb.Bin070]|nr:MAG: hypothetical protein BWX70_02387 [Verrucomicrobia bacterium ADurb.Bin070]